MQGHVNYFNVQTFNEIINDLEKVDGEEFFNKAAAVYGIGNEQTGFSRQHFMGSDFGIVKTEEQTKIMQELIKNRTSIPQYYVRESIFDQIANL